MLTYKEARDEWKSYIYDKSDPFGSCIGTQFAICSKLWHSAAEHQIPAHWKYRPGAFGPGSPEEFPESWFLVQMSIPDLVRLGELMHRMCRWCQHRGTDY